MKYKHSRDFNRVAEMELPVAAPDTPEKAVNLPQKAAYLLSGDHRTLPMSGKLKKEAMEMAGELIDEGFARGREEALLDIQKTLYLIYEAKMANPMSAAALHEDRPWFNEIKSTLEDAWLDWETERIKEYLPPGDTCGDPELLCDWFREHSGDWSYMDTQIAEYLKTEATRKDFHRFFLIDSHLNYRFYDALVLASIHYSEEVKGEIGKHFWDECGNGDPAQAHTRQYSRLLEKLELGEPLTPVWEDWRPYAGFNLYFCFGFNRKNFFKGVGSLAMPELFDPERDEAVVKGLERLGYNVREEFEFFYNHMVLDVEHGAQWLENVIKPITGSQPEAGRELAIGAAMRMEGMRRFNCYLGDLFGLEFGKKRETAEAKA